MRIEDKYAQTISIVYPAVAPSDAYNIPTDRTIKTHITISILGEISEMGCTKEELVKTLRNIPWEVVDDTSVERLALFGPENDFLVMELNSPTLQHNWKLVNEALDSLGITSLDKYPVYCPHITLQHNYKGSLPTPDFLPHAVKVGFPVLWWGKESISLI
jgi:2'-5' RNA ligase